MNCKSIEKLQKEYEVSDTQALINNGSIWKMEGAMGRHAMDLLESGLCMLPKERFNDYYGNVVPSRDDLKKGTKGTYQNCARFWSNPNNYESLTAAKRRDDQANNQ